MKQIWESNTGDNFAGFKKSLKPNKKIEYMHPSLTTPRSKDKVMLILSSRTIKTKKR